MSFTPLSVIYFVAFSHAALMVAILLKGSRAVKGSVQPPGLILSMLLFVMAYKLLEAGLIQSGLYRHVPHLIDWLAGVALLIGPLFLAYVRRMAGAPVWSKSLWLLHLSPYILLFCFQLPDLLVTAEQKVARISTYQTAPSASALPWRWVFLLLAIKAHLATYLWHAWRRLKLMQLVALQTRADDAIYSVQWQRRLCLMLVALETLWVLLFLGQQFLGWGTLSAVSDYWLLLMSGIVLMMGYWGLQKPQLMLESLPSVDESSVEISREPEAESVLTTAAVKQDQYNHSVLAPDTAFLLSQEIKKSFEQEHVYLDSTLNLSSLSEHLGIRKHLVSQVINQTMNSSFFQIVNGHRVAHAKALIDDVSKQFTLERIAAESGFNNRVTFNKAFKEVEGCSPSVYRKSAATG